MKKIWIPILLLSGLEVLTFFVMRSPRSQPTSMLSSTSTASPSVSPKPVSEIQYKAYALPEAEVHTLLIPAGSRYVVTAALANGVDTLRGFADQNKAIAALNGGFFDPGNHKSASYVVIQGQQVADPHNNERLMSNRKLAPYLDKVFERTEFRRYQCGEAVRYDIARHSEPAPEGCQLVDALGAGPRLLPELTLKVEGFLDVSGEKVLRDSLHHSQLRARTAIGITRDGSILWVMAAQKAQAPEASGMTIESLAKFMKTLDVEKAMNLDGGGSSSLYYKGKTFCGEVDAQGNPAERPVNSALLVQME